MEREDILQRIQAFASRPNHRRVTGLVVHCSANAEGVDIGAKEIKKFHIEKRGWCDIGYHFVIRIDGTIEPGRDLNKAGAHVADHNANTIGICYVGGLEGTRNSKGQIVTKKKPNGRDIAKDTRTPEQKDSLRWLLTQLAALLPSVRTIKGHRDYSPDLNGNGTIEPREYIKSCPCFDAIPEYQDILTKK